MKIAGRAIIANRMRFFISVIASLIKSSSLLIELINAPPPLQKSRQVEGFFLKFNLGFCLKIIPV